MLACFPRTILLSVLALCVVGCADGKKADGEKPAKADRKSDTKAAAGGEEAPADGKVWFVSPKDGATVGRKFDVEFGVEGKDVMPAGGTTRDPKVGHHHIIIDGGPVPDMQIVPKDETHLHYGDGSTKTTLLLEPGSHELTMQFADGAHQSYGPDWAATITVNVEDEADGGADETKGDAEPEPEADGG